MIEEEEVDLSSFTHYPIKIVRDPEKGSISCCVILNFETDFVLHFLKPMTHLTSTGRCLEIAADVKAGTVLFEEDAFVFAAHASSDTNYLNNILGVGKTTEKEIESCSHYLAALKHVESLDTARNFMQLIYLRDLKTFCGDSLSQLKIRLFQDLQPVNVQLCHKVITKFQKKKKFPIPVLKDAGARILGVLNGNQLELEEYGGSGLFLVAGIMVL